MDRVCEMNFLVFVDMCGVDEYMAHDSAHEIYVSSSYVNFFFLYFKLSQKRAERK